MGNRSKQPPGERPQRPVPPPLRPGPDLGVPVHSPYTVEGRIEQIGLMAKGIRRLPGGPKRTVALTFFVIVFVLPIVFAIVSAIVVLVF